MQCYGPSVLLDLKRQRKQPTMLILKNLPFKPQNDSPADSPDSRHQPFGHPPPEMNSSFRFTIQNRHFKTN